MSNFFIILILLLNQIMSNLQYEDSHICLWNRLQGFNRYFSSAHPHRLLPLDARCSYSKCIAELFLFVLYLCTTGSYLVLINQYLIDGYLHGFADCKDLFSKKGWSHELLRIS